MFMEYFKLGDKLASHTEANAQNLNKFNQILSTAMKYISAVNEVK